MPMIMASVAAITIRATSGARPGYGESSLFEEFPEPGQRTLCMTRALRKRRHLQ
jgi:hypothetical protein